MKVPSQHTLVGTLPPFTDEPCSSYGGWDDGYEVYRQIRWQESPEGRRLWGAPGNLRNFSAVAQFRELTDPSTFDLFGFGGLDIPTPEQMPALNWFWMTSLPEDAAKQLWKGRPGMDLWESHWASRGSPRLTTLEKRQGQNLPGFALKEARDALCRVTPNEMICDWSTVWEQ